MKVRAVNEHVNRTLKALRAERYQRACATRGVEKRPQRVWSPRRREHVYLWGRAWHDHLRRPQALAHRPKCRFIPSDLRLSTAYTPPRRKPAADSIPLVFAPFNWLGVMLAGRRKR